MKILKTLFYTLTFCLLLSACVREKNKSTNDPARAIPEVRRWSEARLTAGLTVGTHQEITSRFGSNVGTQMMEEWNNVISGLTFFSTPSAIITGNREYPSHENYLNDGEFGIYWHSSWFTNISNSVLAITTFRGTRRQVGTDSEWVELLHADIVVNGRHNFSVDSSDMNTYHLPSVLLHELGHFIGLVHQTDGRPAVMAPSLSRLDSYDTPFVADDEALQNIYSSYTSSVSGLESAKGVLPKRPKEEGQIVQGWIELHTDGECRHYQNGHLVGKHSIGLDSL